MYKSIFFNKFYSGAMVEMLSYIFVVCKIIVVLHNSRRSRFNCLKVKTETLFLHFYRSFCVTFNAYTSGFSVLW